MTLRAVDLFCGVGGFAWGMKKAGITIMRSMDFDPAVLEVHRANIKDAGLYKLGLITPRPVTTPAPAINGSIGRGKIHRSYTPLHVADLTAVIEVAPEIALLKPDVIFGGTSLPGIFPKRQEARRQRQAIAAHRSLCHCGSGGQTQILRHGERERPAQLGDL